MSGLAQLLTAFGVLIAPILTAVVALMIDRRRHGDAPAPSSASQRKDEALGVIIDELSEARDSLAQTRARVTVLEALLRQHGIEAPA